jgi:predicted DNA-binding protein
MPAKHVRQIACYVTPEQAAALKALSERTRVPMQAYLREAVADLLKRYGKEARRGHR